MGRVFLGNPNDDFDPDHPRISDLHNFVEIGYVSANEGLAHIEEDDKRSIVPTESKTLNFEVLEGAYELLQEYIKEYENE